MRKLLLLSALMFAPVLGGAADPATCDAKPFTLGKPALAAEKTKPVDVKPVEKPKPKVVAQAPKPRLLATCKDGKKKNG